MHDDSVTPEELPIHDPHGDCNPLLTRLSAEVLLKASWIRETPFVINDKTHQMAHIGMLRVLVSINQQLLPDRSSRHPFATLLDLYRDPEVR